MPPVNQRPLLREMIIIGFMRILLFSAVFYYPLSLFTKDNSAPYQAAHAERVHYAQLKLSHNKCCATWWRDCYLLHDKCRAWESTVNSVYVPISTLDWVIEFNRKLPSTSSRLAIMGIYSMYCLMVRTIIFELSSFLLRQLRSRLGFRGLGLRWGPARSVEEQLP